MVYLGYSSDPSPIQEKSFVIWIIKVPPLSDFLSMVHLPGITRVTPYISPTCNHTCGYLGIKEVMGLIEKDGKEKERRGIGRGGNRDLFEKTF